MMQMKACKDVLPRQLANDKACNLACPVPLEVTAHSLQVHK